MLLHVRACTCHLYISETAAPIVLKLGMRLVAVLIGGLHNSDGGANTLVRTCTCHFYISGTAAPIELKFGMRLVTVIIGRLRNSVGGGVTTHVHTRMAKYN